MRLFISVNLPSEIKEKLILIKGEVEKIVSKIPNLNIKWEKDENLHITIFFLGEVPNTKLNEVIYNLDKIKIEPKTGVIKGKCINAFPNFKFPRVIFVDLIDESDWLRKLFNEVCIKLEPLGFTPDKKFHNHITIARVKNQIKFPPNINFESVNCDFSFKANSFYLMQSTLTPMGSIYKTVKEFLQ